VGETIWKPEKYLFQEPTYRDKGSYEMVLYQSFCWPLAAEDYLEQRPPNF
jgi:hypothetical protein